MSYKLTAGVLGSRRREKKEDLESFIMTIDTRIAGATDSNSFQLAVTGQNIEIDWGDGNTEIASNNQTAPTGSPIHFYDIQGVYDVKVRNFDFIRYVGVSDCKKIIDIKQWGTNIWDNQSTGISGYFQGCSNFIGTFNDAPNLSNSVTVRRMFFVATLFNPSQAAMQKWDISHISGAAQAETMFASTSINVDISNWCVPLIPTRPSAFSPMPLIQEPIWGTCPA